jgi:stress response protein YsnF
MDQTKTTTETRTDISRGTRGKDTNPDPITGAPGSHPGGTAAGTTAGGVAGAAAGAAIGSVVPGIGTVVGGIAGAVVGGVGGGLAGKAIAEHYDPTAEDAYWREHHTTRTYYRGKDYTYDRDYQPAYRFGWETSAKNPSATFDQAEPELRKHWDTMKGQSRMSWEHAKDATRDAWDRIRSSIGTTRELKAGEKAAIPVVKEDIHIGKREVTDTGGVRVETTVKERPVQEQVNLHEEHVKVERHPVNRPASSADLNSMQGGTIEVTEKREVPMVSKEARVVEEVRVGKEATNRTETVRDTVRETDVKVHDIKTSPDATKR